MDQRTNSFGGIPGISDDDAKKIQDALTGGSQKSAADTLPVLETLARIQQTRAKRMEAEAKQLKVMLGADHPRVVEAEQLAKSSAELKVNTDNQFQRAKRAPKLKANEWSVSGRVLDQDGKPASGLTVRVLDRDRKFDDLLGEAATDEFGDFNVIYHERDFKEMGENLPELYVTVEDAAGTLLYTSRDSVRFNSGRVEYFLIQLGEPSTPPKRTRTRKG